MVGIDTIILTFQPDEFAIIRPWDFKKLMGTEKADMCFTDQPYRLSYTKGGIRHGKPTEGFGAKRNRKYLETDELPKDFVKNWMSNMANHAKPNFSIIAFEAWHNLREMWDCTAEHWTIRNILIWHVPTRHQGFAAKYKFFSFRRSLPWPIALLSLPS